MRMFKKCDITDWTLAATLAFIGAMIIAFVVLMIVELNKPTFSLRKDAWHCTEAHEETHLRLIGKTMMPMTETVCTQWNAN